MFNENAEWVPNLITTAWEEGRLHWAGDGFLVLDQVLDQAERDSGHDSDSDSENDSEVFDM